MDMKPGRIVALVGTLATVAGGSVIFYNWNEPGYQDGLFVGAVLVFGGLLLRIEAAILAGRSGR